MTPSKRLREVVRARFFPHVEGKGFERDRSRNPHFTTFRRISGDRVLVFDVQWDKYGAPRFVINFGEGPASGVMLWGSHVPGPALRPEDCREGGRLQRRRGGSLGCWFQLRKPAIEMLRTMAWYDPPEAVAEHLLAVFPEVEAWWEHREIGPHLYITPRPLWQLAASASAAG